MRRKRPARTKEPAKPEEFERFESLTKRLLKVRKTEINGETREARSSPSRRRK